MTNKFLKKVSRILRNHYDTIRLQATRVKMNNDEWYDVFIFNQVNDIIYMDCLDRGELNDLVRALNIVCTLEKQADFIDGFMMKFTGCIGE